MTPHTLRTHRAQAVARRWHNCDNSDHPVSRTTSMACAMQTPLSASPIGNFVLAPPPTLALRSPWNKTPELPGRNARQPKNAAHANLRTLQKQGWLRCCPSPCLTPSPWRLTLVTLQSLTQQGPACSLPQPPPLHRIPAHHHISPIPNLSLIKRSRAHPTLTSIRAIELVEGAMQVTGRTSRSLPRSLLVKSRAPATVG